jgi:hypothetical protein
MFKSMDKGLFLAPVLFVVAIIRQATDDSATVFSWLLFMGMMGLSIGLLAWYFIKLRTLVRTKAESDHLRSLKGSDSVKHLAANGAEKK